MTRIHRKNKQKTAINKILVVGGILSIAVFLLFLKNQGDKPVVPISSAPSITSVTPVAPELPEVRLDRLLAEKEPVFAFFHSNNCHLCLEMIEVVNEVYPEYEDKVFLVDINVYDELNKNLLLRAKIHSIPTQIFINKSGEVFQSIGLMSADQLRSELDKLSGE
jgi:thiol-disulfide isomerase/thioredoxin